VVPAVGDRADATGAADPAADGTGAEERGSAEEKAAAIPRPE
jgi:hypothetical protein